jgi:hypothetical protein
MLIGAREQRANIAWLLGDGLGDGIRYAFTVSTIAEHPTAVVVSHRGQARVLGAAISVCRNDDPAERLAFRPQRKFTQGALKCVHLIGSSTARHVSTSQSAEAGIIGGLAALPCWKLLKEKRLACNRVAAGIHARG